MRRAGIDVAALRPSWLGGLYLVLTVAVLAPLFAVHVFVLGDTLNHLARIDIMARIGHSAILPRFYRTGLRFVPYWGMDMPVLLLSRFLPITTAGQIFVAMCVLMPPASLAALRLACTGRVGSVPLLGFVLSYNLVLAYGFLNYLFSAGLALMLFAAWIATPSWRRWPRAVLFSLCLILLYLCHAMAVAAYCVMVAGAEIGRAVQSRFRPSRSIIADWAAAASQALPLIAIVILTAHQTELGPAPTTEYGSLSSRLAAMLSPFFFPNGGALAAIAILAALGGISLLTRIRLAVPVLGAALLVAVAAAAMPRTVLNVWGADLRLPLLGVLLLMAALSRGPRLAPRSVHVLVLCAASLAVAKAYAAYGVLSAVDEQVTEIRRLVAVMPEGSRLLVAQVDDPAARFRVVPGNFTDHLAMVASLDRTCFVPFVFTGASPLDVTEAMRSSSSPNGAPVTLQDLAAGLGRTDPSGGPPPSLLGGRVYWLGWQTKFDYVLIVHFGAPVEHLPAILVAIAHEKIADLYEIAREPQLRPAKAEGREEWLHPPSLPFHALSRLAADRRP